MRAYLPFIVVGLVTGSVYSLAALGLVLTYKTSGIFNFAHGSVAAAVAYAFYELRDQNGVPWPIAMLVCLVLVGPAIGLIMERLAAQLSNAPVATKIVASLGVLVLIQQLVVIRYGAETRTFENFLPTESMNIFDVTVEYGQLIIVVLSLAAAVSLSVFFKTTRLGRSMRAVVDNPELLSLTGPNPTAVRRWAWCIGSSFAGLSGVLLAPAIGLDVNILTLLVVTAFGAAAIGLFNSLPMTYVGGLVVGVTAALSTRFIGDVPWLGGLPPSLPFVVLFTVLLVVPKSKLVNISAERGRKPTERRRLSRTTAGTASVIAAVITVSVPHLVGTKTIAFSAGLAYVVIFLSLALLERTSGQLSLAHLAFAAVGASTFSHLAAGAGLPWMVAVLLAGLATVPVGALIAVPALRLSGIYLALATFGAGLLLERLLFNRGFMFGTGGSVRTPRPSIAMTDTAYYYLLVVLVGAVMVGVFFLQRSRLGRLLRAMADSPTALTTYGVNLTIIKVVVFCISSFLAGIGGALYGPVIGQAAPTQFGVFSSLLLVVVLAMQGRVGEFRASVGAAVVLVVLPTYVTSESQSQFFPVVFGSLAIIVSLIEARSDGQPLFARAHAAAMARLERSPVRERLAEARVALSGSRP